MYIGGYNFTDPQRILAADLIERAAVYVVMTTDGREWIYLYVGQTKDMSERFDKHEKWDCWLKNQINEKLYVSVLLVSNKDHRLEIETDLRNSLPGLSCNRQ